MDMVLKNLLLIMQALLKIGIRGVTVSDVRGFGAQGGSAERQAGMYKCRISWFMLQGSPYE